MLFNLFTPSYPVVDVNIPEGWWKSDSQLDIDFANNRAFNSKTAYKGRPSELLTYTSPSPKMVFSESGILKYARHNLLTYSEDFSNAAWTKQNVSLTSAIGPLNNVSGSATLVVPSAVSGEHYFNASPTLVSRRFYTFSCYVKAAGYNYLSLSIGASRAWATFDLTDGTVSATSSNGTDFSTESATIISIGNGWYRVSITALCLIGTSYVLMSVISNTDLTVSYTTTFTGDGVSGIIYAGCQLQSGVHSFDYLATTSAAKYDLPIDYHPTTHAPLGVLIEEQRTNLLTYSQEFDNASWSKSSATIAANDAVAPDGTTTADKLKPDAAATNGRVIQTFTGAIGTTYTLSIYAAADEFSNLRLYFDDGATNTASVSYNLTTGAITTALAITGGNWTSAATTYTTVGDGWRRVTLTFTATAVAPTRMAYWCRDTGDGASGIHVWGAQLEAGAFATSYIQTGSAQVTRAMDQVTLAISAFNFSQTDGTWVASFSLNGYAVNYRVVSGGGEYRWMYGPSAITTFSAYNGSATIAKTITSPVNRSVKAASAYNASGRSLSVDGSTVATDTSPYGVAVSTAFIGQESGANPINGYIKRLTYWNTRKSNAELQGLSA